jgi:hypothetical protein
MTEIPTNYEFFLKKYFGSSDSDDHNSMNWEPLQALVQLDEIVAQSHVKACGHFWHSTRCSVVNGIKTI